MKVGTAGLAFTASGHRQPPRRPAAAAGAGDDVVFDAAAAKTAEEIANAREATRIAELGYAGCSRSRGPA